MTDTKQAMTERCPSRSWRAGQWAEDHCNLDAGHIGNHRSLSGVEWPRTQPSTSGAGQCRKCGRNNPVWFAPNAVWNVIKQTGILCPICFINEAEKAGLRPTGWELRPEPSQTAELRIPDDLKALYKANAEDRFMHEVIIRELIERIARLEGER